MKKIVSMPLTLCLPAVPTMLMSLAEEDSESA